MDLILKEIIFYSLLAGSTVFIGGILSYLFEKYFHIGIVKKEIIHTFIAFGAGIMLSAVSFVLIPEGIKNISLLLTMGFFLLGTLSFYILDYYISKKKTSISQILAMLLDFIPESISLGAMFVINHKVGFLLAIFIALQNLPESFNSYLELRNNMSKIKALLILFFLSFIGLLFALLGYYLLSEFISITSSIMLFASGGILYLIFQDIAPAFRIKENNLPVLGVNFGFMLGMFCHLVIK